MLHIKFSKVKAPENAVLEKIYRKCQKFPTQSVSFAKICEIFLINCLTHLQSIVKYTKQTDLSEREIERWWRKRRAQDKPTTLDKFSENCWRFTFYAFNFIFGLCILWDKSWLWDFFDMFRGYPYHVIFKLSVKFFKFKLIYFLDDRQRLVVVLQRDDGVLHFAFIFALFRCAPQRLLADVHPPHAHANIAECQLDGQCMPRWILDCLYPRCCGCSARSFKGCEICAI